MEKLYKMMTIQNFRMEDESFELTGIDRKEFETNMLFFMTDPEVQNKLRELLEKSNPVPEVVTENEHALSEVSSYLLNRC